MEFAAAAMSAIASGIGSIGSAMGVGGAAGATGTLGSLLAAEGMGALTIGGGAGAGASSLFSAGSILSTILAGTATVAGMMGAKESANEQSRNLMLQAGDAATEADIERLRGGERRDSLRRSLLQALGERDVAAAASGVDLSFGTAAQAREEAARDAESALVVDQATEDTRVARLRERESEFLRSARSTRRAGRVKAFGLGVEGAYSAVRRYA